MARDHNAFALEGVRIPMSSGRIPKRIRAPAAYRSTFPAPALPSAKREERRPAGKSRPQAAPGARFRFGNPARTQIGITARTAPDSAEGAVDQFGEIVLGFGDAIGGHQAHFSYSMAMKQKSLF
jgi:hypothetical protein